MFFLLIIKKYGVFFRKTSSFFLALKKNQQFFLELRKITNSYLNLKFFFENPPVLPYP